MRCLHATPPQLVSVVLGLGALAALWFLLAPAALGGPTNFVVHGRDEHGAAAPHGDLTIVRSAAECHVGDIVAYRSRTLNTNGAPPHHAKGRRPLSVSRRQERLRRPRTARAEPAQWQALDPRAGRGRYFAWITSAWTIGAAGRIAALMLLGRTTSQRTQRRRRSRPLP